jgi:hypothetical protein
MPRQRALCVAATFAACLSSAQAATQTGIVADTMDRQALLQAPITDGHDVQPRADWFNSKHGKPDVSQSGAKELDQLYSEAIRNSEPDHNTQEWNDMSPSAPAVPQWNQ